MKEAYQVINTSLHVGHQLLSAKPRIAIGRSTSGPHWETLLSEPRFVPPPRYVTSKDAVFTFHAQSTSKTR